MAKFKAKVGDLVLIEWQDANVSTGWAHPEAVPGVASVQTVGYVTRIDGAEGVLVCGTRELSADSQVNQCIAIPQGWITHLSILGGCDLD